MVDQKRIVSDIEMALAALDRRDVRGAVTMLLFMVRIVNEDVERLGNNQAEILRRIQKLETEGALVKRMESLEDRMHEQEEMIELLRARSVGERP